MPRPRSSVSTRSVVEVFDKGEIVAYRWSTYFEGPHGEQARKEGKVSVSRVLRQLGKGARRQTAVKQAEAQAWAALEEFARAGATKKTAMTVEQWCEWCAENILPYEGQKPRSLDELLKALRRHVYPHLGSVPLDRLTPEACVAWWGWLRTTEHPRVYRNKAGEVTKIVKKTVSVKTADNVRGYFSTALDRAQKLGKVPFNPASAIPVNREERRDHAEAVQARKLFLTPEQARRLRKAARGTQLYGHVLCGLDAGMRISEANGMLVENLRLDLEVYGVAYVRNQTQRYTAKGEAASRLHDADPKSRAGRRIVFLSRELRALIDDRLARMESGEIPKSRYLFANGVGKPNSHSTLGEIFGRIAKEAGFELPPHNATHVCRRYFVDSARSSGVAEGVRSQVAGHARFATTLLAYEDVDLPQYRRLFGYVHHLGEAGSGAKAGGDEPGSQGG